MKNEFKKNVTDAIEIPENNFHPLVYISGNPQIGLKTYIGLFSEINANKGSVIIGKGCDIASFVSINCADSHLMTIGKSDRISRSEIIIEDNVFIGSHSFIGGNTHIGNNSVIGAGTILINGGYIPPFSLIVGNPVVVKKGYYLERGIPTNF